ncbi:MAG: hypothetical protein IPM82_30245 [Saprospiraceae bacterium]|nr:hypothetical protein [Saprospiraceae bacterium]
MLEAAFSHAIDKVKKLDTYDFDHVVLATSYSEGVWEAFTFQRIAQILYDDAIHFEMVRQNYVPQLNKDLRVSKKIRELEFKHVVLSSPYTEKFKLRHQEFYLDGSVINPLHFPVENGDIFEIIRGKEKLQFILIGQECDLAIRADGKGKPEKEGIRKLQVGTLLRIDHAVGLDKHGHNFQLDYFILDTWKPAWVEFNNPVFVDLNFLDLTAFHPDGLAQLTLTEELENINHLSFAWEKRYIRIKEHLQTQINAARIKIKLVKGKHKNKLIPDLLPTFAFLENLLSLTYKDDTISLGIQRIKRLRSPYSKNLLDKFTRYQSRGADAHDFAK